MFETFSRSWEITKLSFNVIKKDREMLLFPLLAGIFSIIFILVMLFPSIITSFTEGRGPGSYGITEYLLFFITYLGLAFIATFFNVCVVYTTKIRFEGGNATFSESIKFARSKIGLIFTWSIIVATVGLILRIIDSLAERAGESGRIVVNILTSILGMMWSIITIFVVPAMVYNDLRPMEAIKKSVQTLKKTWGESLIRYFGLGMIEFLFLFLGVIVAFMLLFALAVLGPIGIIITIAIAVLYFLGVILVFSVANTVFNTALYVYADTGKIPEGYSKEIMQNAFKPGGTGNLRPPADI
ncbi:MAG: DUF6159 family protein [Candidatus Methanoperedens sp.]|nr:DUF6159 family protein [Candidatus Methanoperedens sp.]MCZ7396865.1 DUF6159 family protein [Candidatus Methanoperedens sp.]